jgi:spermidine synthase
MRTLFFVRPNGEAIIESRVDMRAPHRLILEYTQLMMAGLLYSGEQPAERCLLIGLGGGAMVHFLSRVLPSIALDVVELQSRIIDLARKSFGVDTAAGGRIMQGDGGEFVAAAPTGRYDIVFVDGFLHPGTAGTDPSGVPVDLKGRAFFDNLKRIVKPGTGLVVFNLNEGAHTPSDLAALRVAFGHVRLLQHDGNIVAIALPGGTPVPSPNQLRQRAGALDVQMPNDSTFFFRDFL